MLVMFFGFVITNLPCHVVTLQSDVRVNLAVLKYKIDAYIKEVIILDIFPVFTIPHYYDHSLPLWEVVHNSMIYFLSVL